MLYILTMAQTLVYYQEKVLKLLSGRIDDFYLAGGTALSLYYFHHRESFDLDFFTKRFDISRITSTIGELSLSLKRDIELVSEQKQKGRTKIAIYLIALTKNKSLKLDFVEDCVKLLKLPKAINGINVLSLEDIYLKKIFAACGTHPEIDVTGGRFFKGGRQEAKDFYDLYCLSSIFMKLSDFSFLYCNALSREALIKWYRTYSRIEIKTGLLELKLKRQVDYKDMERHFKKEIDAILEREIG